MTVPDPVMVAIDGPAASGKSTVSRELARRLGWVYVDSGALYRGVTWLALRRGIDPRDGTALRAMLDNSDWRFDVRDGAVEFWADGAAPGPDLRSPEVHEAVSDVAAQRPVREWVCERLREMRRHAPLVMEGRDIGTVVLPDAPLKFFLDADPRERARRRARELERAQTRASLEEVSASLQRRDQRDATRAEAPLRVAPDALVIDSTSLSVDEVVDRMIEEIRRRGLAA